MNAETLKGFFEGAVRGSVLAQEANRTEHDVSEAENDVLTDDLSEEYEVRTGHLLVLCDAVSRRELEPCHLEVIASVLVRSERFTWDPRTPEGALVSKVIYAWEAPEINYVLSRDTVKKFARLLRTGEDTFTDSDWSAIPARKGKKV